MRSLIAAVNDVPGPALSDRHVHRIDDQLSLEVVPHGPPDDPAAEGIEDDGQIQEALNRAGIPDAHAPQGCKASVRCRRPCRRSTPASPLASRAYDADTPSSARSVRVFQANAGPVISVLSWCLSLKTGSFHKTRANQDAIAAESDDFACAPSPIALADFQSTSLLEIE